MQFEKVGYKGWSSCYRLTDGLIEAILTGDVGPRIIRFGFVGEDNEFWEDEPALGKVGGDQWRIYGGHRLWHAPEETVRTYYPDNTPVSVTQTGGVVTVTQPTEPTTGVQKEMAISLSDGEAVLTVEHRLFNRGAWPVELAPWAISPMAGGGVGIIPLPERGAHGANLQPGSSLALWAYTDFTDPRYTWGSRFIMMRQDKAATSPQKVGVRCAQRWIAYARGGHLFVNRTQLDPVGRYPDFGSSVEMYTDANMLEIESLAPFTLVEPGGMCAHVETWHLFRDVPMPRSDDDVARDVLPRIK